MSRLKITAVLNAEAIYFEKPSVYFGFPKSFFVCVSVLVIVINVVCLFRLSIFCSVFSFFCLYTILPSLLTFFAILCLAYTFSVSLVSSLSVFIRTYKTFLLPWVESGSWFSVQYLPLLYQQRTSNLGFPAECYWAKIIRGGRISAPEMKWNTKRQLCWKALINEF